MANPGVGYHVYVNKSFEANDDKFYAGVASFSLGVDGHTVTLTGETGANNFNNSVTVDMETVEEFRVIHGQPYTSDNSSGDRTPGTNDL